MTAGPLMVDVEGLVLQPEEREMLCHPSVSGVILFARNFESPEQLHALVKQLHEVRSPRLLIAVDQEGGRVQRFRDGFVELPALRGLGRLYESDPDAARAAAREHGWLMASEILSMGIDISFAPVLDLDRGISDVIGERAFAEDPAVIVDLSTSYINGMHDAGMAATGKHFPGHGSVKADSHVALPIDERLYSTIEQEDLVPFIAQINNKIDAMMVSHVIYPDVDEFPAGFSSIWVSDILKQRLGFNGMVFSDDITMQAAAFVGSHTERAKRALAAGVHCVVTCNDSAGRDEIIANLDVAPSTALQTRIDTMYGKRFPVLGDLQQEARWKSAHDTIQRLA